MKEVENAAKLTTGYLREYPWGKEPLLKTYEYEFHPGRVLGKPPTAECRWDEGFSLLSNEPAPKRMVWPKGEGIGPIF